MEASQSATGQPQGFSQTDFGFNPNPPPSSNYAAPPQLDENGCSTRLKATFSKKPIAIFQILSVIFGLIAVSLIYYAFIKASAVNGLFQTSSSYSSCHRSNSNVCELDTYFEDQLCKKGRNVESCVHTVLLAFPFYLTFWTLLATVINLCRLFFLPERLRNRMFFKVFMFLSFAIALAFIVSSILLLGYFIEVLQEDLCGESNLKAEATDYVINGPKPNSTSSNSTDNHSNKIKMVLANLTSECPEKHYEKYYHWQFLIGAIFAFITGILCVVTALLCKNESRNTVEPARLVTADGPQLWRPPPQTQEERT